MPIATNIRLVLCLGMAVIGLSGSPAWAEEKHAPATPVIPVDVHQFGVWFAQPNHDVVNGRDHYPSTWPAVIETKRSGRPESDDPSPAPLNVITLRGETDQDVDLELQSSNGTFLAHWPEAESRNQRLRWFETKTALRPESELHLAYVGGSHWFEELRRLNSLFVQRKHRSERFLAFDYEQSWKIPLKLTGGPDKYTLNGIGEFPILDCLVIAPVEGGRRVGWLDRLPAGKRDAATAPNGNPATKPATDDNVDPFDDPKPAGGQQPTSPEDTAAPAAAEPPSGLQGDAETAREKDPFSVDDPATDDPAAADGDDDVDPPLVELDPLTSEAEEPAAEEESSADEQTSPQPVGPPVELVMSPALDPASTEYRQQTREELLRRLVEAGLAPDEAGWLIEHYSKVLFESDELVTVFRLSPAAIDQQLPLEVKPAPRNTARVVLVVAHRMDPGLGQEIDQLVAQLGDSNYSRREAAYQRLAELGDFALPALEKAVKHKDLEIVYRAERLIQAQQPMNEEEPVMNGPGGFFSIHDPLD